MRSPFQALILMISKKKRAVDACNRKGIGELGRLPGRAAMAWVRIVV